MHKQNSFISWYENTQGAQEHENDRSQEDVMQTDYKSSLFSSTCNQCAALVITNLYATYAPAKKSLGIEQTDAEFSLVRKYSPFLSFKKEVKLLKITFTYTSVCSIISD